MIKKTHSSRVQTVLGINIDHVATLRQLRGTPYPDLLEAAKLAVRGGAHQITVHLREDRRHIQDEDVRILRRWIKKPVLMNLEMACTPQMTTLAIKTAPDWVCLVPEKRQEVTTEGGLKFEKNEKRIGTTIRKLREAGIQVSCFIEPSAEAVRLSYELGADAVEIHTGSYCLATQSQGKTVRAAEKAELKRIGHAALFAKELGMRAHAGHGFDYSNIIPVLKLKDQAGQVLIEEYNIGHVIVCRAAFVGLQEAVREMGQLLIKTV